MEKIKFFVKRKKEKNYKKGLNKLYREIIISVIIIASIFTFDKMIQEYTDKIINDAIQDLNMIKQNIKDEIIDNKEVAKKCNEKYQKWLRYHKYLAFYIEHNELEKVETNYVAGKSLIETEKYEEAISEIEKTIFVMQHINDKYAVNLENIF